jgi:hypothetical protein
MKNLKKTIKLTSLMILCFLLLSPAESQAQVKKMSAKELTEESTAVFYGKCTNKRCEWNENRSIIYTYVTVSPEEYIKGNLGSEAVIAVPGGQVDNIIYEVSEMPVFTEGEEVMLFIWKNPSGNIEEEVESEEAPEIERPDKQAKPEKVKLEDFVTRLKGYSKN